MGGGVFMGWGMANEWGELGGWGGRIVGEGMAVG